MRSNGIACKRLPPYVRSLLSAGRCSSFAADGNAGSLNFDSFRAGELALLLQFLAEHRARIARRASFWVCVAPIRATSARARSRSRGVSTFSSTRRLRSAFTREVRCVLEAPNYVSGKCCRKIKRAFMQFRVARSIRSSCGCKETAWSIKPAEPEARQWREEA